MISIVISVCASIVSGMVLFFLQRFFKKRQISEEKREERQHKKDVLMMKSINAVGDLTLANAIAIRDGKTNGELKKALEEYDESSKELLDFLIENSVDGGNK